LSKSVPAPTPVLKLASVLLRSESNPTAVLNVPVVRLKRALQPSAVFPPGKHPSGLTACTVGKRPKQSHPTINTEAAFFTCVNEFIDISFLSSRCIDSAITGLEEAKNQRENSSA
jgi:hypothetical protein